jgi:hypothetical protein
MANYSKILPILQIRHDQQGSGSFGSKRGTRSHDGVDLVTTPGENLYAPENGFISRVAYPYSDLSYNGFVFVGDSGNTYKVFYAKSNFFANQKIFSGEVIAQSEDISLRYLSELKPMKPHIHLEMYDKNNQLMNPETAYLSKFDYTDEKKKSNQVIIWLILLLLFLLLTRNNTN